MVNTQPTTSESGATSAHLNAMTPRVGRGSESLNLCGSPHYLGRGVLLCGFHCNSGEITGGFCDHLKGVRGDQHAARELIRIGAEPGFIVGEVNV